jgi:osmoprotectant transport system permease protein
VFALSTVTVAAGFLAGSPGRTAALAALVLAGAGVLGCVLLTGAAADRLLEGRPPAARIMLGAGAWTALAGLGMLFAETVRRAGATGAAGAALVVAALLAAAVSGRLDSLSLAVEAKARSDLWALALRQHVGLALGALAAALALAVPLALAALASPRAERVVTGLLGAIQVVPALALFGLLVPLLALALAALPALRELGLAAIGPTPTLIGVGLYLSFPLTAAVSAALRAPDPAVVEAARAMGYGEARLTLEIRAPLGAPLLLAGLRVATVQSIGLVTLGGLIGAGGFGALVFEGMSQFAPDLIVLASVPIVLLALAADGGLALAGQAAERRPA